MMSIAYLKRFYIIEDCFQYQILRIKYGCLQVHSFSPPLPSMLGGGGSCGPHSSGVGTQGKDKASTLAVPCSQYFLSSSCYDHEMLFRNRCDCLAVTLYITGHSSAREQMDLTCCFIELRMTALRLAFGVV